MVEPRKLASRHAPRLGRARLGRDQDGRPRRVLAFVPRRLSGDLRDHGDAYGPLAGGACPQLRTELVPIAIGYHVAHYLVFLLIQGQYIVPLVSDPFGKGWNLFGTAGYRVDIAIIGARFAWYAAVAAIVTGHVTAVYLAHAKAMRIIPGRWAALRSQVP